AVSLKPLKSYIPAIRKKALKMKETIDSNEFLCCSGNSNCFKCRNYEKVFWGKGEYVGHDERMRRDLYFVG
ncbi:hypothetical protein ACFL11_01630, partial [Patescibacteria group bacterium]